MPDKMKKIFKKIGSLRRKVKKNSNILNDPPKHARFMFCKYYEKLDIVKDTVLFQVFSGSSISCSPYYMLLELYTNPKYKNLKLYVAADTSAVNSIKKALGSAGLNDVEILEIHTRKYCRVLATAQYLVNNATFPTYFIKKTGQIYTNTWHGTPLKTLGRHIYNSPNEIGNTQRNFLCADYLVHPNDFTFEKVRESYMLDQLYCGKHIVSGYPRNCVLFDENKRSEMRSKFKLTDKKVVVYMPTWRGTLALRPEEIVESINALLQEIEKKLDSDTVFFAKLHYLVKGCIDFSRFNKILPFPEEYETYEFLTAADCLITDYSSVFFDFAVTGRKIILYAYDKEEYLSDRGTYIDYDSLPFTFVSSVEELVEQLRDLNDYADYTEAIHDYVKYDNPDVTARLCDYIFGSGEQGSLKVFPGEQYHNGKENVIIFSGSMQKNGITTALKSLMNMVDHNKRNYFLLFTANSVNRNKMTIHDFQKCYYIPIQGQKVMSYSEAFCRFVYYFFQKDFKFTDKAIDKIMRREVQRLFGGIKFDHLIHYSGYEKDIMELFARMDGQKAIYVHNDLIAESRTKGNLDIKCVEKAYKNFDQIVAIREGTKEELVCSSEDIREKVVLTHNLIDYTSIIERSKLPLVFDTCDEYIIVKDKEIALTTATECTVSKEELEKMLDDNSIVKFINIGRFSREKGHERLIEAFEMVRAKYDRARLIIIGGYGPIYDEVLQRAQSSRYASDIVVIKSLSNVFPVLTRCSAFVLSSYYEGLPVTIMEALVLGKTVISTDIVGPRAFLSQGYGHLVEESAEAIADGMSQFIEGTLSPTRFFDAEAFNRNAIREFESLFE